MKKPYESSKKNINGKFIEILGIIHNKEDYFKNKKYFYKKIKSRDAIVVEKPWDGSFWEHDYFSKIGEVAFWEDKVVYTIDPLNRQIKSLDNQIYNEIQDFEIIEEGKYSEKYLRDSLGNFNSFLFWKEKNKKTLLETLKTKSIDFFQTEEYLENPHPDVEILREFAKQKEIPIEIFNNIYPGTLYFGFHYYLADGKMDLIRSVLNYGVTDWRNLRISKGIEKITKNERLEKFLFLYGKNHLEPIKFYLENPELRDSKLETYNLLDKQSGTNILLKKYEKHNSMRQVHKYGQSWLQMKRF